jgi:hypothetical protein
MDVGRKDSFDPASSSTNTTDIVCHDLEFSTKDEGVKFKSCLECLQKSEKVNGTESDMHWYLYNLRYTISTCLFAVPNEPVDHFSNSPCITSYACKPMEAPLIADKLSADNDDTFGYCSANDGVFLGKYLKPCISCLQVTPDQVYLSNFMVALEAGCEQKPEPGTVLSLSSTVFTRQAVNITEPERDIRNEPEGAGSSTLTTGAIVGIAVGAGLLLLGAVALFIVYWRRQKSMDNDEQLSEFRAYGASPDPFLPPPGGKMTSSLRSYSGQGYYTEGQQMTSGEYYDKMEDEMRGGRVNYNYDPRATSRGPNSAFPTHQAYIPQAMSRGPLHANPPAQPPAPPAPAPSQPRASITVALEPIQPPPVAHQRRDPSPDTLPPPPPGPPPPQRSSASKRSKVPSLILPTVSKLRMPKKYSPPLVVERDPSASSTPSPPAAGPERRGMQISQPVIQNTTRFHDVPLAGGVVYASEPSRPVEQRVRPEDGYYAEVPMKSGKSALYG